MLIAPTVNPPMLHIPSVYDPVHDLIESGFVFVVPQLEDPTVVIQRQGNVFIFILSHIWHCTPERKSVRGTGPC